MNRIIVTFACCVLVVIAGFNCTQSTTAGTIWYIDSISGDDANPGTESQPWKTLAKATAMSASLKPGDAMVLRRGSAWDGEALEILGVKGTEAQPITFGAYGPASEPRPSIGNGRIGIRESEHLVIRDLEVHHSPGGPCIAVSHSGYLTVINNVVHHAKSNGIAYHGQVHHTATIDNIVHDVLANDGISIHDQNWEGHHVPVGPHHWVIDNLLPGNYWEDAIDVASEDSDSLRATYDIKIIGNRIYGARLAGVVSQHQCRFTWVIGNTIMNCGTSGAKALSLGKDKDGDGTVKASGNLLIDNPRCVRLRDRAELRNNTIIHRAGEPALLLYDNAENMTVERNLVLTAAGPWVEVNEKLPDINLIKADRNWYAGTPAGAAFLYKGAHTLPDWRNALHWDTLSLSGSVPGLRIDGDLPADITQWDDAFFARFVPAASWEGHTVEGGIGAFGPGGKRLGMEIVPFGELKENGGYGWSGPQIVQDRYPMGK